MSVLVNIPFAAQILRFGLVGMAATLVHAAIGVAAVELFSLSGLQANVVGFLVAWWVSFFGHHRFTFCGNTNRFGALMRFVPHSAAMFGLAMVVTTLVAHGLPGIPQSALPVVGALVVPAVSFLSSKFFVFRGR